MTSATLADSNPGKDLAARLQIPDVTAEIELELPSDPKAAFSGFCHSLKGFWPSQGRAEACLRRLKLRFIRQAGLIEDRLRSAQRLAIERQDTDSKLPFHEENLFAILAGV